LTSSEANGILYKVKQGASHFEYGLQYVAPALSKHILSVKIGLLTYLLII